MDRNDEKIVLQMNCVCNGRYGHVNLAFCTIDKNGEVQELPCSHPYYDLVIRNQIDDYIDHTYGWRVFYQNVGPVDVHYAQEMYKMLKALDNKLKTYRNKWGEAQTYGEWVLRVMRATHATILINRKKRILDDPIDIRYSIEEACADLKKELTF